MLNWYKEGGWELFTGSPGRGDDGNRENSALWQLSVPPLLFLVLQDGVLTAPYNMSLDGWELCIVAVTLGFT